MNRKIVSFGTDEEDHWVAHLTCGHRQHVRHEPPWMDRPWVLTEEGRRSRLGTELACLICGDPPRDARLYVILLERIPGTETPRAAIERHVEHLRNLDAQGRLVLCGPFADHPGGMLVVRAEDERAAAALAASDPFVREHLRTHSVRTWTLANALNDYLKPGARMK